MWRRVLILSIVPAIFVMIVVTKDVQPDGHVTFVRSAADLQRDISEYYPQGRLGEVEYDGAMQMQQVLDEPVYFDVRLPRGMDKMNVRIHTTGDVSGVRMGLRRVPTDNSEWNYDVQVPDKVADGRYVLLTQEWDLREAMVVEGKVRVLVSVPAGADVALGNVVVDLVGQPMGIGEAVVKIINRLGL